MSLYEDRFDTNWDSLTRKEAMERAFALGVARSLGERHEDEFEAVRDEMGTNYDASIVELAFEEGKSKTKKRKQSIDGNSEDEAVWEWIISDELEDAEPPDRNEEMSTERATDLPAAVRDTPDATERPDPDPEQTDFPEFLE
jgi:hypothetical protein